MEGVMRIVSISKEQKTLAAQCAAVLCVIAITTGLAISLQPRVHANTGIDFLTNTPANTQDGPAVGEIINLFSWRSRSGRTLAESVKGHSLALVVVVNPSCDRCVSAKETLRALRERVGQSKIPYFVIFADGADPAKYFSYADSLNLGAEVFVWSNRDTRSSLSTMPAPSHLLVTNEGLVVNKWNGIPENDPNP
jgi:hypothetical protein